jgi:uncharacterized SAM-binding protein YcdF (DUF218 family)
MTWLRRLLVSLSVVFAAMIVCAWGVLHAGSWLIVEDPLAPADVIVVLSGSMPARAIEAARLYRENYAPHIWVSRPIGPSSQLKQMNIAYLGEEFYTQKVLMASGVPADAIHVLETPAANTEQEVDEIARDCRSNSVHTAIIVTSMAHTRRVRYVWNKRVDGDPRLILRHVAEDTFDSAHWWRKSSDTMSVVREFLGLINASLGFPARPESHQ